MSFRVLGTGMYVPPRVVTNDDLSQFLETNDEWITQRVGVKDAISAQMKRRRIWVPRLQGLLWKTVA